MELKETGGPAGSEDQGEATSRPPRYLLRGLGLFVVGMVLLTLSGFAGEFEMFGLPAEIEDLMLTVVGGFFLCVGIAGMIWGERFFGNNSDRKEGQEKKGVGGKE